MDHFRLDPYEQQLLKVFNSHDHDNCGSLGKDGLTDLCQTLQLEEQGPELIKSLLKDKQSRASFIEFKDALLALLGKMQSGKNESPKKEVTNENDSPEREVCPKYVYGSKKYGRRSRPRTDEVNKTFNDEYDQSLQNKTTSVQRSNSQSEVSSKKRKTSYKLKRCTSLPGHKDLNTTIDSHIIPSNLGSEPELICTEEMLREAWKKLGVGEDGYLNQTELVLVCDAIGLHKLADGLIRSLSDKLSMNYDQKISFNEVLEAIQRDETWFDVLNETVTSESINLRCSTEDLFPDSRTFQYVTLGPDSNGIINTDTLIEMWENIGIHSPKELIHELGFNARRISVLELAEVLEKQTRTVTETARGQYQSPQTTLLQANLSLYQSEIKCLKHILEQLHAEREKLKGDVVDANNRATLLAQEVDDNHTKMEQNTTQQVKLLELRHAEMLKEITSQYSKDKEQLASINRQLEDRISTLETETVKLKHDLLVAQKYSINVEKENHTLSGKISDLERDRMSLTQQIELLKAEKHSVREQDREETEILLTKLTELQIKNSELKDRNDEMEAEIENLSGQVISMKSKASSTPTRNYNTLDQSMEDNISIIYEGVGVGAKRRSDLSPSKDVQLLKMTDGSPRLGKVRKFYTTKKTATDATLEVPFTISSGESGFDTEPESLSASSCTELNHENEINRLQAKIVFLEQILVQHNIPVPGDEETETNIENIMQLKGRVQELERLIDDAKNDTTNRPTQDCLNCDRLREVCANLENERLKADRESNVDEVLVCEKACSDQSNQTDYVDVVEDNVKKLELENRELRVKCEELDDCIELLRNEYEKCEDYWQSKVDEERQYFESEQKVSGEKLNELLEKMKEYEEQYANQDALDSRLPPIVETDNLERQFMDLEQEFEDYKVYHETELFKKDEEISILKEKLTGLAMKQKQMTEAAVQVEPDFVEEQRIVSKMRDLSFNVTETTSRASHEMVPEISVSVPSLSPVSSSNSWTLQQQSLNNQLENQVATRHSLPLNWNFTSDRSNNQLRNGPSASSSQNSTPCRPKRTRKHDKNMYKKNPQDKEQKKTETNNQEQPTVADWNGLKAEPEKTVVLPISAFNNLMSRKNHLEQRVRHLQMCMKQQHCHTEQTLQYYWQQFRGEKADVHLKLKFCQEKLDQQMRICNEQLEKLHRNDIFVKDLYVENAYLFANVERLEKQCRLLTQNNTSNSM